MTKKIDGKKIAEKIKDDICKKIFAMQDNRPNLAVILVGKNSESQMYVSIKEKEAKKVGIDTHLYKLSENESEDNLISTIEHLNNDNLIDGILIQLPLPKKFNTNKIIAKINPKKDVDFFHPENIKKLMNNCNDTKLLSPVIKAVLAMLNGINFDLKNKKCVVLCNSDIFGDTLTHILNCKKANAETIHLTSKNWQKKIKQADLLITAIGKAQFIKKEMVKKDVVVIDIGITKVDNQIFGDVDFNDLDEYASYISPVPGGIGPLTIAMLFENVLEVFKSK